MTPAQLQALQRYVSAVAYIMTGNDHSSAVREVLSARKHMETCFLRTLPVIDLFTESTTTPPQPPALPDIL